MKNFFLFFIVLFSLNNLSNAKENLASVDSLFHIDQMNSHDENFALYFKTREKAVLARGENSNYINDFPKDLYIYNYKTCLLYTSPSPRDYAASRMPSSA